jgi:hypothetical protein
MGAVPVVDVQPTTDASETTAAICALRVRDMPKTRLRSRAASAVPIRKSEIDVLPFHAANLPMRPLPVCSPANRSLFRSSNVRYRTEHERRFA